jgi:crotonobetainyl-CoA:carnitine CoA-transferase CaiB-like acyl-CoA transferase
MILAGIQVADFTSHIAGSLAAMLLGDFGADVVKVEPPDGEHARRWGTSRLGPKRDISAMFGAVNRNKRSLAIDLKSTEGRDAAQLLVAQSDVVVENLNPGAMERLGLGFGAARALRPGVIYCSLSGFGRTGPWADRPGYDNLMQALCGISSITGEPARPPVRIGPSTIDVLAGTHAALGVLAALRHRDATGEGQLIDTSLYDAAIHLMAPMIIGYTDTGELPERFGQHHPALTPSGNFAASDGYFYLAVSPGSMWLRFCSIVDRPELVDDPRFADNQQRCVNRSELLEVLEPVFAARPVSHWVSTARSTGIPVAPITTLDEVLVQEQAAARDLIVHHRSLAPAATTGLPIKLDRTPAEIRLDPPPLGRDSRAVLAALGYPDNRIEELIDRGVVVG